MVWCSVEWCGVIWGVWCSVMDDIVLSRVVWYSNYYFCIYILIYRYLITLLILYIKPPFPLVESQYSRSLFDFLMPGYLGSEKQFWNIYAKPILSSRDSKCSAGDIEQGMN